MAKKTKKSAPKAAKKAVKKPSRKVAKPAPTKKAAPKKAAQAKPAPKKSTPKKPVKKAERPTTTKTSAPPTKTAPKRRPAKVKTEKPTRPETPQRPSPTSPSLQLTIQPVVNQRPVAHKPTAPTVHDEGKTRYSPEELREFEVLILEKLAKARDEFKLLKDTLNRNNDEGTDSTSGGNTKVLEDGAETAEKENLSQQAARQQKYIQNLENALVRIKNGTYGICSVTGKLISRERLIAVPHTTQSIEAKMMQKD